MGRLKGPNDELPVVAEGCQWAMLCKECPWPDCILGSKKRHAYDSEDGIEMRSRMATCLHDIAGLSTGEAAALLRISPSSVRRFTRSQRGFAKYVENPRDRRIVQAYKNGLTSTRKLAETFGVSMMTVWRALSKAGM